MVTVLENSFFVTVVFWISPIPPAKMGEKPVHHPVNAPYFASKNDDFTSELTMFLFAGENSKAKHGD